MSTRWTITLVVMFATLSTAYWWTGRYTQQVELRTIESRNLFNLAPEEIDSISIERAGEAPIEAARGEEGWKITQPYPYIAANQGAWDRVAATLAAASNERTIEGQLDDSSIYGIDPPKLRVLVNGQGTLSQLDFGALDPTQSFRYARIAGGALFLTPAGVYEELNRPLIDLRDRRVFRAEQAGFDRIQYRAAVTEARPEPFEITFERQTDGNWLITSPIGAIASRKKLDELSSDLLLLQGDKYIDTPENPADYGLATPFAQISAATPGSEYQRLNLGWIDDSGEKTGLFAQIDGQSPVFVIDANLVTRLPESVEQIREDRLFTREASQLKSITYRDSEQTLRFEIDAVGGWKMVEPPVDDTDELAVSTFISILKQLQAQSFPEPANVPNPRITLDFEFANDLPPSRIAIGGSVPDSDPAEIYAWEDNGTLITLPASAWPLLKSEPFKFQKRNIFEFDARDAEVVELTLETTKYRYERNEQGLWQVIQPEGLRFESQDDMRAVLDAALAVKAVALVSPRGGNEIHGLETPFVEIEVWVADTSGVLSTSGKLTVGNLATGQGRHRFARSSASETIMLIDQGFIDDIRAALDGLVAR